MPVRRLIACALGALAVSCGGGEKSAPTEVPAGSTDAAPAASAAASPAAAPASAPTEAWVDPEPPGAQALAESVLRDPVNRDKTTSLRMTITTIVGQTTAIAGSATALAAKDTSVEDRLAKLGAKITETEITIRLPGSILFDFDSAALRADAERTLGELAQVLSAYAPRPARVEGHTDSIASDAYNQGLSERRAASVVQWLAAHGVAAGRLQSAGLGESRPVADNATAAGRQQNRRVEVIIAKGA
jgi:outer membrane protein OmpA-like peptidoglycan-associated protein